MKVKRLQPAEKALEEIIALSKGPITADAQVALRKAVAGPHSLAIARATRIIKENHLVGFEQDLVLAFARCLVDPVKKDPGCNAKLAILGALDDLDYHDVEPFLLAARHVQKEASWGPPVDTAGPLRGAAIRALAHMGYDDLLLMCGEMLGDPEPPVRQAAADALAHCEARAGAGLILAMLSRNDEDPVVYLSYLSASMRLAPDWGLPRLSVWLSGMDEERSELAALALGESGRDDAAGVLLDFLEATPLAARRAPVLKALGLHRSERALVALLEVVATGRTADARAAVAALGVRRFDSGVPERVRKAMEQNAGVDAAAAYAEAFGGGD